MEQHCGILRNICNSDLLRKNMHYVKFNLFIKVVFKSLLPYCSNKYENYYFLIANSIQVFNNTSVSKFSPHNNAAYNSFMIYGYSHLLTVLLSQNK